MSQYLFSLNIIFVSGIYIIDEDGNEVAFYVFASDGISYSQAVKQQAIVIGPGQREALLLQFQKAGTYKVMQLIINDFQGTGESENQVRLFVWF